MVEQVGYRCDTDNRYAKLSIQRLALRVQLQSMSCSDIATGATFDTVGRHKALIHLVLRLQPNSSYSSDEKHDCGRCCDDSNGHLRLPEYVALCQIQPCPRNEVAFAGAAS